MQGQCSCSLCDRLIHRKPFQLNASPVCRRCRNAYANRRQLGFLIDFGLLVVLIAILRYTLPLLESHVAGVRISSGPVALLTPVIMFLLRDGFKGYSPGKWMVGLRTLEAGTLTPIGFIASLRRNLLVLFVFVPCAGSPLLLILAIICSNQLLRGRRLGEYWANTLVVWCKYQHKLPFDKRGILCLRCGYDLTGNVSGICPECGTIIRPLEPTAIASPVSPA